MTHPWPFPSSDTFRSAGPDAHFFESDALESVLASAEVGVWQLLGDGERYVVTPATYFLLGVPDGERPASSEHWLRRVHRLTSPGSPARSLACAAIRARSRSRRSSSPRAPSPR